MGFKPMKLEQIAKTEKAVQDFCGEDYHEKLVNDMKAYMKNEEANTNKRRRQD